MKLKLILSCALAAGLMNFATDKAQASGTVVTDDSLDIPLNLKLTFAFQDTNGNLKKMSATSKTVLKDLGFKNAILAYNGDLGDVLVVDTKTKTVLTDLTVDGIMTADFNSLVDSSKEGKNGSFSESEVGTLELQLNSDGNLNTPAVVSKTAPTFNGFYSFDITGIYTGKFSDSADDKNFNYTEKVHVKAPQLSGTGVDTDVSEETLPVIGNASFSGSGKLVD